VTARRSGEIIAAAQAEAEAAEALPPQCLVAMVEAMDQAAIAEVFRRLRFGTPEAAIH
jgi:hypothetical protein